MHNLHYFNCEGKYKFSNLWPVQKQVKIPVLIPVRSLFDEQLMLKAAIQREGLLFDLREKLFIRIDLQLPGIEGDAEIEWCLSLRRIDQR